MIQNQSLVDRIITDLQRQISLGDLQPGRRLPSERNLCAAFGVGRTTIREALMSLIAQGFVTKKGRGVVVTDPEDLPPRGVDLAALAAQVSIKQLYDVRKLIEVRMAAWAAIRATTEDLAAIRLAVETTARGRTFHDALARAVHNPVLAQVYEAGRSLFFRLPFFWQLFDDAEVKTVRAWRHDLACRWHRHILRAIEQRDSEEAEGAMFQHLDIMEKDLLTRLRVPDGERAGHSPYVHPMLKDFRNTGESASQDPADRMGSNAYGRADENEEEGSA